MAIDRDETLRKAEKLLRQGRLDAAIEEYARVAQDAPDDLATINKLGELYQRAGQTHTAITYYTRVADQWLRDGLHAKASSHYKKILKLRPDDEGAMLQLIDALTHQGLLDEAKTHLRAALERRQAAGDRPGAEDLILRLADLDPNDFDAKLQSLRIKLSRGQTPELAAELRGAITELDQRGRADEADAFLRELIRLDPADIQARVRVARSSMNRGDIDTARAVLPPKPRESKHYDIVWIAAELDVLAGDLEGGSALLMRALTIDRVRGTTDVLALAERLRKKNPAATWACAEALVEDRAAVKDFAKAADHLKRFLKQTPGHVPALLRLVEVCVDGDLEPDLTLAQAMLADAYLQVGEAGQARVIAEDLLSREPKSAAHRDRLKRALVALGEDDPDAIIAEHLHFLDDVEDKPAPTHASTQSLEPDDLEPDLEPAAPPAPVAAAPPPPPPAPPKPVAKEPVAAKPPAPAPQPPKPQATQPPAAQQPPARPTAPAAPVKPPVAAQPPAAAPPAAPKAPPKAPPAAPPPAPAAAPPRAAAPPAPKAPPAPAPAPIPPPEAVFDEPPLDFDEPDFGSHNAAPAPSHEPSWPSDGGNSMFEPDLGGGLDGPDDLLAGPGGGSGPTIGELPTQPESPNGHRPTSPSTSWEPPADHSPDLEVDLTGALNAIVKPSVTINDALGATVSRPARSGPETGAQNSAAGTGAALAPAADAVAAESVLGHAEAIEQSEPELDAAFDSLRAQAKTQLSKLPSAEQVTKLLKMAETYQAAGMIDEARGALEQASQDPRFRFQALAALGRLYKRNDAPEALRWLERAAEASAPSADEGRALLYDLADTLERTGEGTRALAVWLDLLADQEDYRDVRGRVDRLVQGQR